MVLSTVLKTEPLSPSIDEELIWFSEETLYSSLEHDDLKLETDIFSSETKVAVASQLLESLEKLVNIDELIKEEPFFMSEVKILPMLEEIEQSRYPLKNEIIENQTSIIKVDEYKNNNIIYDEFNNVYNTQTLTPPQSPPCDEPAILTTLKPLESPNNFTSFFQDKQSVLYEQDDKQLLENVLYRPVIEYPAVVTPQPDIAHELAVVDELVRTRVENMQWSSTPSSPSSHSGNSSSSFEDCSSDDPEWAPEVNENDPQESVSLKNSRKRTKPYSRCSPEDKKSRKKEQNKNAATRYRLKKKAEVEEILSEEKNLMNEGDKLNEKISDIQREIKYLKGLMRDLFKAKGLI